MALTKVTNTGIADDAVTTDKIEDGTVVAADIAPGTIANAKLANSSITLNGSSVSLGGSANLKHIDWQALTVADGSTTLTAEAGKGYFLDTNAGIIEVILPSSPTRGDTVVLADYSGTFATNQIIINTSGELLDSTAGNDFKVTTNNSIVELVYVDSAKGWLVKLNQAAGTTPSGIDNQFGGYDTVPPSYPYIGATGGTVTESGDFKIHTFTGDGCFVVTYNGIGTPTAPNVVDYLVIAGGGGGASGSGGGGAGGFRESSGNSGCYTASPLATPTGVTLSIQTYPISVGAGGTAGGGGNPNTGCNGTPSVFSTITSAGGGGGGSISNCGPGRNGRPGGSGGGGGSSSGTQPNPPGGSGNTPPVSPPQGNNGGSGRNANGGVGGSGGGGGAGTVGGSVSSDTSVSEPGGDGVTTSIDETPTTRAGGGGGGSPSTAGTGGSGGGGDGGNPGGGNTAGTANTGSGGGGMTPGVASNGGSGLVIIRYKFQ